MIALLSGLMFTACDNDNDGPADTAAAIEGIYSGTLKPLGYTDEPERAYVALKRYASDAVSVAIKCDQFDIDTQELIMRVNTSNGAYELTPERGQTSISGNVRKGVLTLTFGMSSAQWFFQGSK